jgi:hypothetical protein
MPLSVQVPVDLDVKLQKAADAVAEAVRELQHTKREIQIELQ